MRIFASWWEMTSKRDDRLTGMVMKVQEMDDNTKIPSVPQETNGCESCEDFCLLVGNEEEISMKEEDRL